MTITIPSWLIWLAGIAGVVLLIPVTAVGLMGAIFIIDVWRRGGVERR